MEETVTPGITAVPRGKPSWASRLFAPVDIAPIVWFRIAFGVIMVWEVGRYFVHGWIADDFIKPTFHFTYYGFNWVHPWPGWGMFVHFALLGLLAAAISLGLFYRAATVLFFLGFCYVFLLDESYYLNHFYLVCLYSGLLIFVPAHRAFSLDIRMGRAAASPTVPAWSLWLLRAQIGVVYFMGGIAKLSSDWLQGQPMGMWLRRRTDFPVIGQYFDQDWMAYAFSYGGLAFDLLIVPLVLWRRTRWLGFGLAAIFNLMNARLFRIGIFPWLSLGATVLLFADSRWLPRPMRALWGGDQPKRVSSPQLSRPSDGGEGKIKEPALADAGLGSRELAIAAVLGGWLALQILVPLRHLFLYPGQPEWTEEGHRFAWRMKLRHKTGSAELVAQERGTGRTWTVTPSDFLTVDQVEAASDHPEMILQLCHHVALEWRREHGSTLEVRVRAQASLNGRPLATLIDPEVDLAAEPRTLRHAPWIKPLTLPLPH